MSTREPLRISSAFEDEINVTCDPSRQKKRMGEKEKGATEGGVDG
jgi:hypothetical protein